MRQNESYRLPLVLAIIFHILLFAALFFHFISHGKKSGEPTANIIQASVVNSPLSMKQILKNQKQQQRQLQEQRLAIERIQQEERIKQEKLAQQEKLQQEQALQQQKLLQRQATEKALALKQQAALQHQQELQKQQALIAERKLKQEKIAQEELKQEKLKQEKIHLAKLKQQQAVIAKRKAEQQKQQLAKQITAEQQKMFAQQLAQDQKQLTSAAQQAAEKQKFQAIYDKYNSLIERAIEQNWLVPDNVDKNLSCKLLIHLAPGGVVLNVQVIKSSGDPVLDRSATTAVFKSSPLPVPNDPQSFDKFRELRLTVKPENILSGS